MKVVYACTMKKYEVRNICNGSNIIRFQSIYIKVSTKIFIYVIFIKPNTHA